MLRNIVRKTSTALKMVKNRELTIRKSVNLGLLYSSMVLKRPRPWGKPYILIIEPTNYCNLQCPLCPTGNKTLKRKKGFMSLESFKKIIDQLEKQLLHVVLHNYGEPLLNQDIYKMVSYAKKKGLSVLICTNGHFFNNPKKVKELLGSGLNELLIALDGATQKTQSIYRKNSNFEQIIKGIKAVVAEKKAQNKKLPIISIQFLVMKHNEHEVEKIRKLAKDLGVNKLIIKSVSKFSGSENVANKFIPQDTRLSRYDKKKKMKGCSTLWKVITINWDGTIVPCCYDAHNHFAMGNALKEGIDKIWTSPKFNSFRKEVLKGRRRFPICKECTEGLELSETENIS